MHSLSSCNITAFMTSEFRQITSIHEIKVLVNNFYAKVRGDELIGPIFNDGYGGSPFPPQMKLGLKPEHVERWLKLFNQTVDENFTGLKAE